MKAQIITLSFLFFVLLNSFGSDNFIRRSFKNDKLTDIKIGLNESRMLRIPPPECFTNKSANLADHANFVVRFNGFSSLSRAAFTYATNIWESLINSPVNIRIDAYWADLKGSTLASCGSSSYYLGYDGMAESQTYYPVALAEKMTKTNLNDSADYELIIYVDSETDWYYKTDGKTPADKYDLVTVLLHEICHGLGMTKSFFIEKGLGFWGLGDGYGLIYDKFVINSRGDYIIDTLVYPQNSASLEEILTSRVIYFEGPVLKAEYGKKVPLYAPDVWESQSSVAHLSTAFSDGENSLMTPFSYKGESIHDPGIIAKNITSDLGWKQIYIDHEPLINSEEIKNIEITADIYPDFSSVVVNPKMFYSIDSTDYIEKPMTRNSSDTLKYSTSIPISKSCYVSYYVTAGDKYGRSFKIPANAPEINYSFFLGDDTLVPEITHYPNTFLMPGQDSIMLNAYIKDGFGIDSVWVEYLYNDIMQEPVGMEIIKNTQYQLALEISSLNVLVGDSIKYRIVARDKSKAGNIAYFPEDGWSKMNVEEIPDYVESLENNFESANKDFILQGFTVTTPDGFKNGALHTVHPYEFAGENNYLEYIAQIRYPVKVNKDYHYLSFDEIVLVEPGEIGTVYGDEEFWDYVIAEASKDEGKTWLPLEPGWDSRYNTNWWLSYNQSLSGQFSQAIGTPDMYKNHIIDILSSGRVKIDDEILIRFRLYSDPYANGWGWAIDNLKIQTVGLSDKQLTNATGIKVFPNPVEGNEVFIKANGEKVEEVTFYNFQGSLTFKTRSLSSDNKIDLPSGLKGGFIVVVKTKNQTSHSKLLIK